MNLKKYIFCVPFGIILGHVVSHDGILVDPAKITIFADLPPPSTMNQLRTTLGHIGYDQKFIRGFAKVTTPMENLLKKDIKFQWSENLPRKHG